MKRFFSASMGDEKRGKGIQQAVCLSQRERERESVCVCVCVCVCARARARTHTRMNALSCLVLCDPMDCNLPGSSVHGISQARIQEWVAISFSRGSSQLRNRTQVTYVSGIAKWVLYHRAIWEDGDHSGDKGTVSQW